MAIFCLFFFFKQKTAYEMRISDWSSDVALPISIYPKLQAIFRRLYWDFLGRIWYFRRTDFLSRRAVESLTAAALNQSCQALATAVRSRLDWRDRKSVVKGKSVSGSVDCGGRRISIKKKHRTIM